MICPNCGYETIGRNLEQNSLFHMWMKVLSDELGYLSIEDVKRDVKRHILGVREVVNRLTGELSFEDFPTSRMTQREMWDLMNRVKIWAQSEMNIYLPYKHEEGYEEMMTHYKK